ncbi:tRNA 2'-phosphotransferase 1 [Zancudomyces culisetae]|uniref:tRNA 2'-phosphotransferase 1 n=1 Tax=Zancudomyces culisetae TaxID=1213189 RepID=A0A1R1PXJ9_ZANCU|nr:tRNA 2'-phosphotransferase 1 [Zancudomyces culisetae]|eukprot:OMH85684.1 tRNA 2'-phosphotransferase 1 [Zancudomyces culisetae]
MNRQHIHLAPGLPGESKVISGTFQLSIRSKYVDIGADRMRASADIYIYIDVKSAMDDGIEFFISENNVILTSGIDGVLPTRHFKKVDTRSGNLLSPS